MGALILSPTAWPEGPLWPGAAFRQVPRTEVWSKSLWESHDTTNKTVQEQIGLKRMGRGECCDIASTAISVVLTSHMDAGSSLGYSSSDPVP